MISLDQTATLYNQVLTDLLDKQLPLEILRSHGHRQPWFDAPCMEERRNLCKLRKKKGVTTNNLRAATRAYTRFLRVRRYAYYSKRVLEEKHPARRWRLIRESTTIGNVVPTSACPSPDVYSKYLNDKLSDIRRSTNGAPPPDFTDRQQGSELSCFSQTSHEEVS